MEKEEELDARDIARMLNEMADLMEIRGDNHYRIRAYQNAARSITGLEQSLYEMWQEDRLTEIDGIGSGLAATIDEIYTAGTIEELEELKRELPDGILELLEIPGLGPKRAHSLFYELNVNNIEDLQSVLEAGEVRELAGFGEKLEKKLQERLKKYREYQKFCRIKDAMAIEQRLEDFLDGISGLIRDYSPAGSLRRKKDLVRDIDMIIAAEAGDHGDIADELMSCQFLGSPRDSRVRQEFNGGLQLSLLYEDVIEIDFFLVEPGDYSLYLQRLTGSKAHNERLEEICQQKSLKLDSSGFFDSDGERIEVEEEKDIYEYLDMQYIIPELRESRGELEAARHNRLPASPETADIKGDLHLHTHYSDGTHSLEDMIEGALRRGYEYIAITDHSVSLRIADGLSLEKLREQGGAIERLNDEYSDIEILKGIEVDILPGGELDYADEVLDELDLVIASIHSGFNQSAREITERIVGAMENSAVDIIGHPQGRLLASREAYRVNMTRVIEAASATDTCLEINASPSRLDLDDQMAREAVESNVKIAINTDAHHPGEYDQMKYGVNVARRGWVNREDIINTYSTGSLLDFLS